MQPSPISTDQQLGLILQGASEEISWMATDPLVRNAPVQALRHDDAEAGHILVLGDHNQAIVDLKYPATGEGPVKKRGEGWYSLNIDTSAFKDQSLLIFHRMRTGTNNQPREIRKQQLIRIAHPTYYRYLPIFRLMLDKSRKSLASPDQLDGQDVANYGYSDAMLTVYMDLACGLINLVPPTTSFSVLTFPSSQFGFMLIQASMLVALESQGVYSIDTDYPYSMGGNSLTIDHLSKIVSLLGSPLFSNFLELLKLFKQKFRSSGAVMVQLNFSYSIGRFMNMVPSGFFSRFGLGVGPTGVAAGIGT